MGRNRFSATRLALLFPARYAEYQALKFAASCARVVYPSPNAWFAAYLAGSKRDERVAEKRFRPEYDVAFRAWLATRPFTNPNAPKGPQYMPQYKPAGAALANVLDAQADAYYAQGEHAAVTGDRYVRVTVVLASVLFIVGISSHFPLRSIRIGLVCLGAVLLIFAAAEILQLPGPPA